MGAEGSDRKILLFEPIRLREVTVRNRIMISPMCQYCAEDAVPKEWHYVHLGSRAVGGAGIVMTEATAVESAGRITPFDLGLWNDEQESSFSRIARFIRDQGAVPAIQLAHAGRKASHARPWEGRKPLRPGQGGWQVLGPSPIPWEPEGLIPRELEAKEIQALIGKFRESAGRAHRAGFRLLEVHAAHGYLFHSFLSPLSNKRGDAYGGEFGGRSRFLIETVKAIREVWPSHLPLFVRLSAVDWVEGGWSLPDTIRLARILSSMGADVIDCSSGGIASGESINPYPGYQVPFSEAVRRETGCKTVAVGMISEATFAEEIVSSNRADFVAIGRAALWDAYWPYRASRRLGVDFPLPVQYARSEIFANQ